MDVAIETSMGCLSIAQPKNVSNLPVLGTTVSDFSPFVVLSTVQALALSLIINK